MIMPTFILCKYCTTMTIFSSTGTTGTNFPMNEETGNDYGYWLKLKPLLGTFK